MYAGTRRPAVPHLMAACGYGLTRTESLCSIITSGPCWGPGTLIPVATRRKQTERLALASTIRDVALAVGVSMSTVSRAFTMPELVNPETLERVRKAADKLGYRPNRAARALITGRTGNLGVVVPDLMNPFFPAVVK